MRLLLALCLALEPAFCRAQVSASAGRAPAPGRRAAGSSPIAPAAIRLQASGLAAIELAAPRAADAEIAPREAAAETAAPAAETTPAAAVARDILSDRRQIELDLPDLPKLPAEAAAAQVEKDFRLLTGEGGASPPASDGLSEADQPDAGLPALHYVRTLAAVPRYPAPPEPPALSPEQKRSVHWMFFGSAAFKIGMESVTLGVALSALQMLGGATHVAVLGMVYGLAQAVSGAFSGALTDRFPAARVLAASILGQALAIASGAGLYLSGHFSPWLLYPMYGLFGAGVGLVETARRAVPPLILGSNENLLRQYNAKLHIFYETSGAAAPLLAGALIAALGPMSALWLQPPAYLLAAFAFQKVRPARSRRAAQGASEAMPSWKDAAAWFRDYWNDLKRGKELILGSRYFFWLGAAMVLPEIVHRLFEGMILPVYASRVLGHGALSAPLLTASNSGELAGALILLWAGRRAALPAWARLSALGLLGIWAFHFSRSLWVLFPLTLSSSLGWAISELSLLSDLQARLGDRDRPRALSFLFGAFVIGSTLSSLALGAALDHFPSSPVFLGVCAALSAVSGAVWFAAGKIRRPTSP